MLNHLIGSRGWTGSKSARRERLRARIEVLETRWVMAAPTLGAIADVTLIAGAPLNIALDGFDADNDHLTFSATSTNGNVTTFIPVGNDSLRLHVVQKNAQGATIADFGVMEFQLFEDLAPVTTARFQELVNSGFYNSLTFHRIMQDFMIQGGDPSGNGTGGSGVQIDDELNVDLRFTSSGILASAKSNDDTVDSQFFITAEPTRWLDFNHTIFGFLTNGDAVRQNVAGVAVGANNLPTNPVVISSATIFQDFENGVLRLSAPIGTTGTSTITVTVSDGNGGTAQRSFNVTVVADDAANNGNPFLGPIADINMTVGQTINRTITATDAEGNPVNFYAEAVTGSGVSFEMPTVNVTPVGQSASTNIAITATLPGQHDFYFVVRRQNYTGFDQGIIDVQRITINVAADAPTAIDLLPESDNGGSNTDNFTSLDNSSIAKSLKFKVSGVWQGSTVTLKIGDQIIGTATVPAAAAGVTPTKVDVTVTTNGTAVLAAGVNSIIAVQSVEDVTSAFSTALNVIINSPTLLPPIGNKTLDETTPLAFSAAATDADAPSRETLAYSLAAGAPAGASINPTTGQFQWTPGESQGGQTYSITVQAQDSFSQTVSQTFQVTVNDVNLPPVLGAMPSLSVKQGNSVSAQLTATDTDLPVNTLTFSLAAGSPAGGSISAAGLFTFQASANHAEGPLQFTVIVSDGHNGTDTKVLTVQVLPGPKLSPIGDHQIAEGDALLLTATGIGQVGEHFTYFLAPGAPAGASIDQSSGSLIWQTTEADGPGVYEITIIARDSQEDPVSETFFVTVTESNQDPLLNPIGNQQINEGQTLSVQVVATDADLPANTLTYSLDSAPATAQINPTTGLLTWITTEADGGQQFTFKVRVADSAGGFATTEFTTTVIEVNRNPTLATPPILTILAGQTAQHQLTATDPDLPANTLIFSLGEGAPDGASITEDGFFEYTSPAGQSAQIVTVTVLVSDGQGGTDSKTLKVNVGQPPVLDPIGNRVVDEGGSVLFTAAAHSQDPLNHISYFLAPGAPADAFLEEDAGAFVWHTTESDGGQVYTITVIARDEFGLETSETLQITVNEVNQNPVLATPPVLTVEAGETAQHDFSATDPDLPANELTFSLAEGSPIGASITSDGLFQYLTAPNQPTETITVTVIVDDGQGGSDSKTVTIHVQQLPVLDAIADRTVTEGGTVLFTAFAHTPDPLNHMTYRLGPGAPTGAFLDDDSGGFIWKTTEADGPGVYTLTVIARDSHGLETSQTVQITVLEQNTSPTLAPVDPQTVTQGETLSLALLGADADLPVQTLAFSLGDGAPAGMTIDPSTGVLTWSPDTSVAPGVYSIVVLVADTDGLIASQAFDVTVLAVEEEVLLTDDPQALANAAAFPGAAAEFGSIVGGPGSLVNNFNSVNSLPAAVNSIGQGLGQAQPGTLPFIELLAPQNEEQFFFRSVDSVNHLGADTGVGTHWVPGMFKANRPTSSPDGAAPANGNPAAASPQSNRNVKRQDKSNDPPLRSARVSADRAHDAAFAALNLGTADLALDALLLGNGVAGLPMGAEQADRIWTHYRPAGMPTEQSIDEVPTAPPATSQPAADDQSSLDHHETAAEATPTEAALSALLLMPLLRNAPRTDDGQRPDERRVQRRPK